MIHFSACLGCDFRAVIFECFYFFWRDWRRRICFLREKKRERRNDGEGWVQCTSFEGGARRFVVKGSRAYLRATDIYIYTMV